MDARVVTPKCINHLRPSFTFLPRWNISPQRPLRRACSAPTEGRQVA